MKRKNKILGKAFSCISVCFTIVELLIVIAIISILSCLLLPSLQSAKSKAKQIYCANNLKQVSIGLNQYLTDWNDYCPRYAYSAWYGVLWNYVGYNGDVKYQTYQKPGPYRCPAEKDHYILYQKYNGTGTFFAPVDYGINSPAFLTHRKLQQYGNPTKTFFIADSHNYYLNAWYENGGTESSAEFPSGNMAFNHLQRANMLFIDAHFEQIKIPLMPGQNTWPWKWEY